MSSIYKTAVNSLDSKKSNKNLMYFKLHELSYLSYLLFIVQNQLIKYTEAMADVKNYVLSSLSSIYYVDPPSNASKQILYYQLFDEFKTIM